MTDIAHATVERIFLGWDRPALAAAASYLVERHAGAGVVDLSGLVVVLPGARASRRLIELLLDEVEARGLQLLPPELVTVGHLPERMYRPELPLPPPEVEGAAWRTALAAVSPAEIAALLPGRLAMAASPPSGTDEADGDAAARDALAETAATLHAAVGAEGHDFADVAARCRRAGDLLHDDEERWRVLASAQHRFRTLLERAGYRDREGARVLALDTGFAVAKGGAGDGAGDGIIRDELVLVGVVELPGVVRRFIEGWPGRVRALIHAPAKLDGRFDALGAVPAEGWREVTLPIPDRNLRVVGRPVDQGAAVAGHLRALDGRRAADEISIGVPDPSIVPHVVGALEGAGVPTRYAAGRPMHRTAPWRLIESVAAFLDGRRYDALSTLVRHPDLPAALRASGLPEDDPIVATTDAYHALHLPSALDGHLPGGPESGESGGAGGPLRAPSGALFRIRGAIDRLLRPVAPDAGGRGRRLAEWGDPIRRLLLNLYPGQGGEAWRALDRNNPADRDLAAFAVAAERAIEGFEALPPSLDREPVPAHRALRLLLGYLRRDAIPPAGDDAAVELLGWLELHLDDAPELVLTGVNEPFLPESVTADPFLPHTLRALLGLPDNERRRARDLYLLSAILASRPGTLLVTGRRDTEGNPLRPSRLLLADAPEAVAARLLRLLGEWDGSAGSSDPDERRGSDTPDHAGASDESGDPDASPDPPGVASPVARALFTLPPEPIIQRAGGPPDRIAVTSFTALLRDPYRYALERVLDLDRVTDEARELDPMGFGVLAHAVAQRWAEEPGADEMAEEEIRAALDHALDDLFEKRHGRRPLPALRVQREHLRARLHRYAALQSERNQAGWRIVAVEASPPDPGVAFDVDGAPIIVTGRIDRVDAHPETGVWQLLDLKTSARPKMPEEQHGKGRGASRRWIDLQLPLYLRILAPALRTRSEEGADAADPPPRLIPPGATIEAGYLLLPRGEVSIALAVWDDDVLDDAIETARDVVRLLRENRFSWDPGASSIGSSIRSSSRAGDPLGIVVGRGVLRGDDDADDGENGDVDGGGADD